MFVKADRLFRRIRGEISDDRGASLVVVVALMAMGFVVAIVIAAAALFSIRQNVAVKSNVQAFAAAEAGRDAVVSAFEIAPESCPATAQYTDDPNIDTDPAFTVTVHATDASDAPTSATGVSQRCPLDTDKWVVLQSTGTGADGSTTSIDAVYPWEKFRTQVAGGGLGYMDSSLSSNLFSSTSGDTIIKKGDFSCNFNSSFDGNVFVLNGSVSVASIGSCTITGDLYASGNVSVECTLLCLLSGSLYVGGQLKTLSDVTTNGRIEVGRNAGAVYKDLAVKGSITVGTSGRIDVLNGGRVAAEQNITSSANGLRAAGDVVANQSITANGEVRSNGGSVNAGLDITGSNTVRAARSIVAGRNIDGGGIRQADGGNITAVGYIGGNGARTASGSVLAGGDINAGGTVTANGGDIHAGGTISGGARTASRSVLGRNGISSGAVTANGGNISTNGAITGNSSRIASGSITAGAEISNTGSSSVEMRATSGSILAAGAFTSSSPGARTAGQDLHARSISATGNGLLSARDVLAAESLTLTTTSVGSCAISRDITAGGVVNIPRAGSDSSTATTTRCIVGGHLWSYSGGSTTSASTLPTHGGTNSRSQVWVNSNDVKARGGWTANSRYRTTAQGTNGVDPTPDKSVPAGSAPGVPTVPVVAAPAVAAPAPFALVLNEDPEGTWETYDDLQLRTTWVDLGTYTTWPGYTPVGPVTAANCNSSFFGSGGTVRSILRNDTVPNVPKDVPVVIDATQCNSVPLGNWSATPLRRDAVLLVKNASFTFASFTATEKHHLAIIQVDQDNSLQTPAWNPTGDPEPVPNCSTGQSRINMTFNGGGWDPEVNLLLYSPCGIDGNFASSWRGHIYTHNDKVNANVLTTLVCEPMRIVGVVDLPCNINDIAEFGNMNVNDWRLGDRASQTEH